MCLIIAITLPSRLARYHWKYPLECVAGHFLRKGSKGSIHYYAQVQAASFDDYQSGCRLPPLGLVTTPWMRPLHMPGLSH